MNRRTFLGLLGLFGCKDELEDMSIAKRWFWLNQGSGGLAQMSISNADNSRRAFIRYLTSTTVRLHFNAPTGSFTQDYTYLGGPLKITRNGDLLSFWELIAGEWVTLLTTGDSWISTSYDNIGSNWTSQNVYVKINATNAIGSSVYVEYDYVKLFMFNSPLASDYGL